jgi:hypothetical protein
LMCSVRLVARESVVQQTELVVGWRVRELMQTFLTRAL